jgi:hypothetical protein
MRDGVSLSADIYLPPGDFYRLMLELAPVGNLFEGSSTAQADR